MWDRIFEAVSQAYDGDLQMIDSSSIRVHQHGGNGKKGARTCANRFRRWAKIGVWDRIFEAVSQAYDGDLQMIDSSSIRVHQHGGNGKKGARTPPLPPLGTTLERVHGALAGA